MHNSRAMTIPARAIRREDKDTTMKFFLARPLIFYGYPTGKY